MKKIMFRNQIIRIILEVIASILGCLVYINANKITIEYTQLRDYKMLLVAFSCFMLAATLKNVVMLIFKQNKKNIDKISQITGMNDEDIYEEYRTADRNGSLLVNNHFTFIKKGFDITIIPYYDIVWVYKKQAIKGSSRSLQYFLVINTIKKKSHEVLFYKKDMMDTFIQKYAMYPHIILGYDDKINGLFEHRIKDFLELQYNENNPLPDNTNI